jgi:hypothetical protein
VQKTLPGNPPPSVRQLLEWYRGVVESAAVGERLTAGECQRAALALDLLGLPEWAWHRDLRGHRRYSSTDDEHLREELRSLHPHVLLPIDQAEQLWIAGRNYIAQRRRQTSQEGTACVS